MAKLTSVIYWVCMMVTINHVSGDCGNTITDTSNMAVLVQKCADPIMSFAQDDANHMEQQLNKICSNLECRLECIETAIGNCDQTNDFYVLFDRQNGKAAYRGLCADKTVYVSALTNCGTALKASTASCTPAFQAKVDQMKQYQQAGNAELYKQTACSGIADMASCTNIAPSGQCTQAHADFMNMFLQTVYSLPSTCSHSSDTQFFRDYSGPVDAPATCGSGTQSFTVSLLLMPYIIYAVLFKYV